VTPHLKILTALPQYEARPHYSFFFFFGPFFFFAMTLFLGCAAELRQGWFKSQA
jgi:hypothetical protein